MQRTTLHGLLLGAAILASAVALLTSCGDGEEEAAVSTTAEASPTETAATAVAPVTPGPGTTVWRWGNVTITVPDSSDLYVKQDAWTPEEYPPSGGLVLWVMQGGLSEADPLSSLVIDAETGAIVREEIMTDESGVLAGIKGSIKTGSLDLESAPWPFNGSPDPSLARESWGEISFIRPSPDSGLRVSTQINDPGGECVGIVNGISGVGVCVDDSGNLVINREHMVDGESAGLEEWLNEIRLCRADVSC